jgi:hypothetical protein
LVAALRERIEQNAHLGRGLAFGSLLDLGYVSYQSRAFLNYNLPVLFDRAGGLQNNLIADLRLLNIKRILQLAGYLCSGRNVYIFAVFRSRCIARRRPRRPGTAFLSKTRY